MTKKSTAYTSSDCFRRIHESLGAWIEGVLEGGFDDDPLSEGSEACAADLMKMADLMRQIEEHTDI